MRNIMYYCIVFNNNKSNIMERFTEIEKILRREKISGFIPSQNITTIGGKQYANVLFHSCTHADKSIQVMKDNGFCVLSGREKNVNNAYFKYFVTITTK